MSYQPVVLIKDHVSRHDHPNQFHNKPGLVAASSKTAFDGVVNGNFPIFERGHVVLLMDDWCEQVPPIIGHFDAIASQNVLPRLMQEPIVVLSNLPKAKTLSLIEAGRGKEKRQIQVTVLEEKCSTRVVPKRIELQS